MTGVTLQRPIRSSYTGLYLRRARNLTTAKRFRPTAKRFHPTAVTFQQVDRGLLGQDVTSQTIQQRQKFVLSCFCASSLFSRFLSLYNTAPALVRNPPRVLINLTSIRCRAHIRQSRPDYGLDSSYFAGAILSNH